MTMCTQDCVCTHTTKNSVLSMDLKKFNNSSHGLPHLYTLYAHAHVYMYDCVNTHTHTPLKILCRVNKTDYHN